MIPDPKGTYAGWSHVARLVPYDTLVRVPEGDAMTAPAPPAPTVVIAGVRYTTTATADRLFAVFHQAGPWGLPDYDPTSNTWTLHGQPLRLLPALERAGIILDGPGDVQANEDEGATLAPPPLDVDVVADTAHQGARALLRIQARAEARSARERFDRDAAVRDIDAAAAHLATLRRLLGEA